jgi:hypothetical protein
MITIRIDDDLLWLGSRGTKLRPGHEIFVHAFPPKASGVLIILDRLEGVTDTDMPGRYFQPFQIIVRNADLVKGRELAWKLFAHFDIEVPAELPSSVLSRCKPKHMPLPFRRSDGDIVEWSVNFDAIFLDKRNVTHPETLPYRGQPAPSQDFDDLPDFSLLFENGLI